MKRPQLKKSLQTIITGAAAGALLIAPAGAVFATNGGNYRGQNQNKQDSSREYSRQRGDSKQHDGWWNDWRFGQGKENWENQPKTCEQRQASVNKETRRLKDSAGDQLQKIGWQVGYQKWYVERYQLTPEGYDELSAATETDKTEAETAINVLVNPTVDCAQPVENDKVLLQTNKKPVIEALRDYHVGAINITYAVQAAK